MSPKNASQAYGSDLFTVGRLLKHVESLGRIVKMWKWIKMTDAILKMTKRIMTMRMMLRRRWRKRKKTITPGLLHVGGRRSTATECGSRFVRKEAYTMQKNLTMQLPNVSFRLHSLPISLRWHRRRTTIELRTVNNEGQTGNEELRTTKDEQTQKRKKAQTHNHNHVHD